VGFIFGVLVCECALLTQTYTANGLLLGTTAWTRQILEARMSWREHGDSTVIVGRIRLFCLRDKLT
jgi:hypothetical protein